MFKRRKPDEIAHPPAGAPRPAAIPVAPPPAPPAGAAAPLSSPPSTPSKDSQTMGRSPFPAPPSPPATPSAPGATAPNPAAPAGAPRPPGPGGLPGAPGTGPGAPPRKDVVERRTLVVGRGISVQGVVQDAERLVVEGTVEASMIHAAELSVAPGGMFRGEVEVEDAELAGTVDGTLTVRGNLTIRSTGRLIGTARCRRLQVEDGGQVTGRLEMITDNAAPRPAGASPVGEPISANRPAPAPTPAVEPTATPAS